MKRGLIYHTFTERLMSLMAGALLALLPACRDKSAVATPQGTGTNTASGKVDVYAVKGEIRQLNADGKTVVVKHEAVPGYMPAMTMPFEVKNTNELRGLRSGDLISFRMLVTKDEGWIDQVRVLQSTNRNAPSMPIRESTRVVRKVDPLSVGDLIPNYPFTNQFGKPIQLQEYRGKALAITFIFTRCPFPNFCPRMLNHFLEAQKALKSRPEMKNWHLLSLSFDPEFDTPTTLKAYGLRYDYDPEHWSLATGALIEIDAITEQFGLVFPREGAGFAHNLRTVVIDAQGKVQKVLLGNEWQPQELVEEMLKAAGAKK